MLKSFIVRGWDIETTMLEVLRKDFGFQSFRPNQEGIMRGILDGRDVFTVMPTGGGKSLCYQLPAMIMEGTTVIISPLIALMKDQVDAALENGIPAAFMNSSMSAQEISAVYRRLRSGEVKLLYIAPERFAMPHFLETLKTFLVSLFAIDEAHCVSEWGHDFRPDYLSLSIIPKAFLHTPVAAFTATATLMVQEDIIRRIGLRNPHVVRASFNRENLFYEVRPKQKIELQILEFLMKHKDGPGIIYRTTRDAVMTTAGFLVSKGIKALPYHAGLSPRERTRNQEAFNRDEAQVVVATIAFGMGIDKSNVRFVIHGDLPKNVEAYYQETGRAGRDGEPARCLLFFSRGDIPKIRYFIDQITEASERSAAIEKLNQMAGYASHNICRRKQLLGFFGEDYPEGKCTGCDICEGSAELIDITVDAQIVMSAASRTGQRFGVGHIVDMVTGSDTKRIRELRHNEIKTYGVGKNKNKEHWRSIIHELLAQDIMEQEGGPYPVLKITRKGLDVLCGREKAFGLKREEAGASLAGGRVEYDEALFERLRALRKQIAEENEVPPYIIFSDRTLHEMCRRFPAALADMRTINGVGGVKLERYGEDFVREIKNYLEENPRERREDESTHSPVAGKKGKTAEATYELFKKGMSLEDIAGQRGLALSTVASHMAQAIRGGHYVDIDLLVAPAKRKEIESVFLGSGQWGLNPVIEHFGGTVTYEEAGLIRAWLQRKKETGDFGDLPGVSR